MDKTLENIYSELRLLRRDLRSVLPSELPGEYENQGEILESYKRAVSEHSNGLTEDEGHQD